MSDILEEEVFPYSDDYDGFYDPDEDIEEEMDCSDCGIWCPDWGGDNICLRKYSPYLD